ncbi:bacteriohemerythrin [Azomonas macrocytogenes]|uniref:Hemerythrin-like metal-binding protein n=1 Tax=Azomonas macrocytogenes TaxID=69962 RepID=A0A839T0Y9_AZOMA|nr:hemerythrin family protein [Azomonas macrocytogenes]MBB3103052.1 hemerythrin-like metal-binding protein [Azomonas macrocytogenes]
MPSPNDMLQCFEASYTLGNAEMDKTHHEFLVLCLETSNAQGAEFGEKFKVLFEHTSQHFAEEEAWMKATSYPALSEHRANHQRTLGDMDRFCQRALTGRGAMARAWLSDNLMSWFDLHAKTMDSALAAHLKLKQPGSQDG